MEFLITIVIGNEPEPVILEGQVYCDVHVCVHDQTTDPYYYGYEDSGEEPECGPADWRVLELGEYVDPNGEKH